MSGLFPELAAGERAAALPPSPAPPPKTPRRVMGNRACVESFARALALPVEVTEVEVTERDKVRFGTQRGETRRSIFLVHPNERAWKRVAGFGIAVEGAAVEPDLAKALMQFLARYQRASLRSFAERVRAQPEVAEPAPATTEAVDARGAPPAPWNDLPTSPESADARTIEPAPHVPSPPPWNDLPGTRDDPEAAALAAAARGEEADPLRLPADMHGALFYNYGSKSGWRTFFEDHDLYRGGCSHIEGRVATVMHREIECTYNRAPDTAWGRGTFGALPDEHRERPQEEWSMLVDTDLGDRDVIMGGDARLDAALDAIAAMPVRPDVVLLQSTCVPVVTGDDLEASAERARKKHRLPITVVGYIEHPHASALVQQLAEMPEAPRPDAAALIGMPRIAGVNELREVLEEAGVSLLGPMVPDLPAGAMAELGAASLLVTYDEPHTRHDVARVLERLAHRRAISPPPPFGPEASRRFCREIADALGRAEAFDQCWEARRAFWASTWEALVERAKEYRVGFVIERADWRSRVERRFGVPLLDAVRAMGFGVDLYVFAREGEAVAESDDAGVRVRPYGTPEALEALLREPGVALVYSELRYDRRIPRTGHASFSLEEFRVGPTGAVATLETLLGRCEAPWFRRYGALAGTAFAREVAR